MGKLIRFNSVVYFVDLTKTSNLNIQNSKLSELESGIGFY